MILGRLVELTVEAVRDQVRTVWVVGYNNKTSIMSDDIYKSIPHDASGTQTVAGWGTSEDLTTRFGDHVASEDLQEGM